MLVLVLLAHLSLSGAMQSGVFGGKEAKPHSRPYMASLQVGQEKAHVCGGVLIREDFVLTAAHCLKLKPDVVVLGAHDISKAEKSQQRVGVSKSIPHPKYPTEPVPDGDPRLHQHDIMLLKLKTKAKLGKAVKVMSLPKKDGLVPAGVKCWVAGWGMKAPHSNGEKVLREVQVRVEAQQQCEYYWQKYYDSTHMMCTSTNNGQTGFCQGDSGGPLVCNTKIQGTVAFTHPDCNQGTYPQVSTRISAFLPWIKEIMGKKDEENEWTL
ncbi:granzyme B-like [Engraulis encrasicolus]|uniref:granzyme B-like n=1 Tax=Engraulis encrasicolus TaxID=184585 RepID=UPI002FD0EA00